MREACAGDEALQREVESLLAEVSGAAGFLSTPAVAMARSALSDSQPTMLPTADGPHGAPNDASASRRANGSDRIGSNACSAAAAWVRCTRPSTSSTGAVSP